MKFDNLPLHAKQVILEQFGERIGTIDESGGIVALYLINDFYVEVFYKGSNLIKINKVAHSQRLILYCPELDL